MYCHNFYPLLLTKVITHSMNYKYFAVLQVYIIKQIKYILTDDEFFSNHDFDHKLILKPNFVD